MMDESPENRVTLERRGPLLLMGLNRPSKMNAFDYPMFAALSEAYSEIEKNPEIRCGILFAHGKNFTSGLDLMDMAPRIMEGGSILPEGGMDPWGLYGPQVSKPVVCALHGKCLTLGIELALACDIRVATSDTVFAQIEIKRGIFPFGGATFRLMESVGWGNAMRYLLTGDEFTAPEAFRMGMIQEVVEPGRHLDRAIEIATTISKQAPMGVYATLASARAALLKGPIDAASKLRPEIMRLLNSQDAQEGLMPFVERREAKFVGK